MEVFIRLIRMNILFVQPAEKRFARRWKKRSRRCSNQFMKSKYIARRKFPATLWAISIHGAAEFSGMDMRGKTAGYQSAGSTLGNARLSIKIKFRDAGARLVSYAVFALRYAAAKSRAKGDRNRRKPKAEFAA